MGSVARFVEATSVRMASVSAPTTIAGVAASRDLIAYLDRSGRAVVFRRRFFVGRRARRRLRRSGGRCRLALEVARLASQAAFPAPDSLVVEFGELFARCGGDDSSRLERALRLAQARCEAMGLVAPVEWPPLRCGQAGWIVEAWPDGVLCWTQILPEAERTAVSLAALAAQWLVMTLRRSPLPRLPIAAGEIDPAVVFDDPRLSAAPPSLLGPLRDLVATGRPSVFSESLDAVAHAAAALAARPVAEAHLRYGVSLGLRGGESPIEAGWDEGLGDFGRPEDSERMAQAYEEAKRRTRYSRGDDPKLTASERAGRFGHVIHSTGVPHGDPDDDFSLADRRLRLDWTHGRRKRGPDQSLDALIGQRPPPAAPPDHIEERLDVAEVLARLRPDERQFVELSMAGTSRTRAAADVWPELTAEARRKRATRLLTRLRDELSPEQAG